MYLLTEDQINSITVLLIEDYGSQLTIQEVSEIIGVLLENISGFEILDSQSLTNVIKFYLHKCIG